MRVVPVTRAPTHRPAANTAVLPVPLGNSSPALPVALSNANEPVFVTTIEMLLPSMRWLLSITEPLADFAGRFRRAGGAAMPTPAQIANKTRHDTMRAALISVLRELAEWFPMDQNPIRRPNRTWRGLPNRA